MSDGAIVRLTNLTRAFEQGGERIEVLRGIDLTIAPGEIVALLGPSGSGKSTMLQAVGLLEGGFGGRIEIAGTDASALPPEGRTRLRREHLGFVYQFHHLLPDFNAIENVVIPQLVAGRRTEEADERSRAILTSLGLGHRLTHRPSQLSGGEQQRVALARAIVNGPAIILADEPTGNLDTVNSQIVLEMFRDLNEKFRQTILMITHNPEAAAACSRTIHMRDGHIVD